MKIIKKELSTGISICFKDAGGKIKVLSLKMNNDFSQPIKNK